MWVVVGRVRSDFCLLIMMRFIIFYGEILLFSPHAQTWWPASIFSNVFLKIYTYFYTASVFIQ